MAETAIATDLGNWSRSSGRSGRGKLKASRAASPLGLADGEQRLFECVNGPSPRARSRAASPIRAARGRPPLAAVRTRFGPAWRGARARAPIRRATRRALLRRRFRCRRRPAAPSPATRRRRARQRRPRKRRRSPRFSNETSELAEDVPEVRSDGVHRRREPRRFRGCFSGGDEAQHLQLTRRQPRALLLLRVRR